MSDHIRIKLHPLGKTLELPKGTLLGDILFEQGVEFPCGGKGQCRGCKIKVLEGTIPPSAEDQLRFSHSELLAGWRLACRAKVETDLTIELAQWKASILSDNSDFSFVPKDGFGIAVDVGTTTLVAQLVDLHSGQIWAVRTDLNPQARYGADIMSRIEYSLNGGGASLTKAVQSGVAALIDSMLKEVNLPKISLRHICLSGNTVMHHLFCGLDVEPLSHVPFESSRTGLQILDGTNLGWDLSNTTEIYFLPCLGGFVGSDILAGIMATGLHKGKRPSILIDLGTNGEIAIGCQERILCTSTAAGPAFEGARIHMGMRAITGAISEVNAVNGHLHCRVLGNAKPVGICGSGLVDAVACFLDMGAITPTGRISQGNSLPIVPPVSLTQRDIRELQYGKGAIAAGIRILTKQYGISLGDLENVYLAGAFGNYINHASARRIGLLPFPSEKIHASGNTSLRGTKQALFNATAMELQYLDICSLVKHVSLNEDMEFQNIYADEMSFNNQ